VNIWALIKNSKEEIMDAISPKKIIVAAVFLLPDDAFEDNGPKSAGTNKATGISHHFSTRGKGVLKLWATPSAAPTNRAIDSTIYFIS
jgi:hypothetical protein